MKFTDLTQSQRETLVREGTTVLMTSATLFNAARHLRKGRVGKALFFVVLWHGYCRNAEDVRNNLRHKEIVACMHKVNGVSPAAKVPHSVLDQKFGLN